MKGKKATKTSDNFFLFFEHMSRCDQNEIQNHVICALCTYLVLFVFCFKKILFMSSLVVKLFVYLYCSFVVNISNILIIFLLYNL